jgi:hypothetical protein
MLKENKKERKKTNGGPRTGGGRVIQHSVYPPGGFGAMCSPYIASTRCRQGLQGTQEAELLGTIRAGSLQIRAGVQS